jgi:hypothetical protein
MQKDKVVSYIYCVAHLTQCFTKAGRVFKFEILQGQVLLPARSVGLFDPVYLFLQNRGVFAAHYDNLSHTISSKKFKLEKN